MAATVPTLGAWLGDGAAGSTGPAYAVTAALSEAYDDCDTEELEYLAGRAAATAALGLLAADPGAPRRRVVLAVDVDDAALRPDGAALRPDDPEPAAVTLAEPVPKARWASALVDDGALSVLDDAEAPELSWYAVQELPALLALD